MPFFGSSIYPFCSFFDQADKLEGMFAVFYLTGIDVPLNKKRYNNAKLRKMKEG